MDLAVIGLGRVGSILLQQLEKFKTKGIHIVAVAEPGETPGKIFAKDKNINIKTLEEISSMGNKVDIIFECTGDDFVRKNLRSLLMAKNNLHTIIATETIASLICLMLTDKELPDFHKHKGY